VRSDRPSLRQSACWQASILSWSLLSRSIAYLVVAHRAPAAGGRSGGGRDGGRTRLWWYQVVSRHGKMTIRHRKTRVTFLLSVLCASAAASTVEPGMQTEEGVFGELLTLDCRGRLHLLANSPLALSFDLSDGSAAHEFWIDKILERARDRCSASDSWLKTLLPTVEWALSWVDPTGRHATLPCEVPGQQAFLPFLPYPAADQRVLNVPSSCSFKSLAAGEGCLFQ